MKRRCVSIICVFVSILIVSTACGKKSNEQGAEGSFKNKFDIATEDEMTENESEKNLDSEMLLDKQVVTEEWESEEETVQEQEENNVEENVEQNTEENEAVPTDNTSDSNTLKELSEVPFA